MTTKLAVTHAIKHTDPEWTTEVHAVFLQSGDIKKTDLLMIVGEKIPGTSIKRYYIKDVPIKSLKKDKLEVLTADFGDQKVILTFVGHLDTQEGDIISVSKRFPGTFHIKAVEVNHFKQE